MMQHMSWKDVIYFERHPECQHVGVSQGTVKGLVEQMVDGGRLQMMSRQDKPGVIKYLCKTVIDRMRSRSIGLARYTVVCFQYPVDFTQLIQFDLQDILLPKWSIGS